MTAASMNDSGSKDIPLQYVVGDRADAKQNLCGDL